MTHPSESDRPRGVIDAFREVCDKFLELSRTPPDGSVPLWSGTWTQARYVFRHPVKSYMRTVREGFRTQSGLGTLAPFFPLEAMADFLSKYSESQLTAIKSLSEINLRRVKSMITENGAFKAGVPIGSAYALLQVSNKLVTVHGSSLDLYRQLITSSAIQKCIGYLLAGFIFLFIMFAVQYLFTIGPRSFALNCWTIFC